MKKQSDTSNPLARRRHDSFEKLPEWVGLRGPTEPDSASGYDTSNSPHQRPLLCHLVLRLPPLVHLALPLFFRKDDFINFFLVVSDKKTSKLPKQERDIMYSFQKLETDLWGMWVR